MGKDRPANRRLSLRLPVIIYHNFLLTPTAVIRSQMSMRRNQSLSDLTINKEELKIDKKKIGKGSYGTVYRATYKGLVVAAKQVIPKGSSTLMRELSIMASVNHPATLGLVGFQLAGDNASEDEGDPQLPMGPMILTPLMTNGALDEMLKKEFNKQAPPQWNATAKSKVVFGIAVGMAYLHSLGIVHRDLKPANVLLNENFEPVVADFGLSRLCDIAMTGALGSPLFMAPELLDEYPRYDGAVDVFAYAVLLYQLFSDNLMFDDGRRPERACQVVFKTQAGRRLQRQPEIPDFYWDLITRAWKGVPEDRLEFCEIIELLQREREKYAFPGTDMSQLEEYEKRMLQGVELVNRTKPKTPVIPDF